MPKQFRLFGLVIFFISAAFSSHAAENLQDRGDVVDYEQLKIKSYKHWDLYLH